MMEFATLHSQVRLVRRKSHIVSQRKVRPRKGQTDLRWSVTAKIQRMPFDFELFSSSVLQSLALWT